MYNFLMFLVSGFFVRMEAAASFERLSIKMVKSADVDRASIKAVEDRQSKLNCVERCSLSLVSNAHFPNSPGQICIPPGIGYLSFRRQGSKLEAVSVKLFYRPHLR